MSFPKKIRIIPRLDVKGPNVVKGIHTEGLRILGDPRELAEKYYRGGADELIYMDIVASLYGRNVDLDLVKSVAERIFIPLTVGGGMRSIHDISNALRAGADKVAINTYAIKNPEFLREAVRTFGSQCIVLSLEAKQVGEKKWEAYTDGGRERTNVDAVEWVKRALSLGVGEILLTSIDRDGTYKGFDLDLIRAVTGCASVPVVVYGGARDTASIGEVVGEGRVDGIAIASLFHYGKCTIKEVKDYLNQEGFSVRLSP